LGVGLVWFAPVSVTQSAAGQAANPVSAGVGEDPTSPLIVVAPVLVIPEPASTANVPAVPSGTDVAGACSLRATGAAGTVTAALAADGTATRGGVAAGAIRAASTTGTGTAARPADISTAGVGGVAGAGARTGTSTTGTETATRPANGTAAGGGGVRGVHGVSGVWALPASGTAVDAWALPASTTISPAEDKVTRVAAGPAT